MEELAFMNNLWKRLAKVGMGAVINECSIVALTLSISVSTGACQQTPPNFGVSAPQSPSLLYGQPRQVQASRFIFLYCVARGTNQSDDSDHRYFSRTFHAELGQQTPAQVQDRVIEISKSG